MKIYTRRGDDGTTGLLYGSRVPKSSPAIEANGAVDEAQAALGWARAQVERGSELDELLVILERELWILMAEVATGSEHRDRLTEGESLVTEQMVESLEHHIDTVMERFVMPAQFAIPGQNKVSAALDVARTVVRRAERLVTVSPASSQSLVGKYLNRLSDLVWALARWQEGQDHLVTRQRPSRRQVGNAGLIGDGEADGQS